MSGVMAKVPAAFIVVVFRDDLDTLSDEAGRVETDTETNHIILAPELRASLKPYKWGIKNNFEGTHTLLLDLTMVLRSLTMSAFVMPMPVSCKDMIL